MDADPSKSALYQIGAGYAAIRPLADLKQPPARVGLDNAVLIGRTLSVVVDAPRADEDTILFRVRRAFGDLPLGRRVLTRRRSVIAVAMALDEAPTQILTAPDLGGALFKACAPLADDELVVVFTDAHREAARLLRALGGAPIDALDEKPISQRRPSPQLGGGPFAFAG